MKAPGINLQDYGYVPPPPAYDDIITNEQPPRPVPRTSLARSSRVSNSLTNMRNEQLSPHQAGGQTRSSSCTRNSVSPTNRDRQVQADRLIEINKCKFQLPRLNESNVTDGKTTATLSIPTKMVGLVKGKYQETVKTIQKTTETSIQFIEDATNPTITEVEINGSLGGIARAESSIFDTLKTARQLTPYESQKIVGQLIPKVARWTQLETIQFFKETTVFFGIHNDVLFLRGFSEQDVVAAERKMYDMLTQEPDDRRSVLAVPTSQDNENFELEIATSQLPLIYGPDGSTVLNIQNETGTDVSIFPRPPDRTILRITGSVEGRSAAEGRIKKLLAEKTETGGDETLKIVIPTSQGGLIVGTRGEYRGQLIRDTGAQITLNKGPVETTVEISGDSGCVLSAAESVVNRIKESKFLKTRPCSSTPAQINDMVKMWDMHEVLEFYRETGSFAEVHENTLVLTAFSEEALKAAENHLKTFAHTSATRDEKDGIKMKIPSSEGGMIVGKDKCVQRSLEQQTGAFITVRRDILDPETTTITICGEPNNVVKAELAVFNKLARSYSLKDRPCSSLICPIVRCWNETEKLAFYKDTKCFIESRYDGWVLKAVHDEYFVEGENKLQQLCNNTPERKVSTSPSQLYEIDEMEMGSSLGKSVMGENGVVVRGVEQRTRPQISRQPDMRGDGDKTVVWIKGDQNGIDAAKTNMNPLVPESNPNDEFERLDCQDIVWLVNSMIAEWTTDEQILFEMESRTKITRGKTTLVLHGVSEDDLTDAKKKLVDMARQRPLSRPQKK